MPPAGPTWYMLPKRLALPTARCFNQPSLVRVENNADLKELADNEGKAEHGTTIKNKRKRR